MLLQLISDILDLSKIEAGTMEFIDTDFELNKVMRELESLLCLKLSPEKNVTLSFEPGLPECHIHSERNRLSQLVINLVTNAIKFTQEGSIRFGYKLQDDKMLYSTYPIRDAVSPKTNKRAYSAALSSSTILPKAPDWDYPSARCWYSTWEAISD